MAGLCDRCMTREARSPSDIYCEQCENELRSVESLESGLIIAAYAREVIEWMRGEVGRGSTDNDLDLRIRLAIRAALVDKDLRDQRLKAAREKNEQMRELLLGYRQDHNESDADGRCDCVLCRDTRDLIGKEEAD